MVEVVENLQTPWYQRLPPFGVSCENSPLLIQTQILLAGLHRLREIGQHEPQTWMLLRISRYMQRGWVTRRLRSSSPRRAALKVSVVIEPG